MKGVIVRGILPWLLFVWITLIQGSFITDEDGDLNAEASNFKRLKRMKSEGEYGGDGAARQAGTTGGCKFMLDRCEEQLFPAKCSLHPTLIEWLDETCCDPKSLGFKNRKKKCPKEMNAFKARCKDPFKGLEMKFKLLRIVTYKNWWGQKKTKKEMWPYPCECVIPTCEWAMGREADARRNKGEWLMDHKTGDCCDRKRLLNEKCPAEFEAFQENSFKSCKMILVLGVWHTCATVHCANAMKAAIHQNRGYALKTWKKLCCKPSILHDWCPRQMAWFQEDDDFHLCDQRLD